jgi:hypothetical protein
MCKAAVEVDRVGANADEAAGKTVTKHEKCSCEQVYWRGVLLPGFVEVFKECARAYRDK